MNKIIIVVIIAVIIGIGVAISSVSIENIEGEIIQVENEIVLEEITPVEVVEETGRSLSVELTESIGLKSL